MHCVRTINRIVATALRGLLLLLLLEGTSSDHVDGLLTTLGLVLAGNGMHHGLKHEL